MLTRPEARVGVFVYSARGAVPSGGTICIPNYPSERMTDQQTRNNHYVPKWYQRGFLAAGQSGNGICSSPSYKLTRPGNLGESKIPGRLHS